MFSREVGGDPADFNFDLDGDADDTDVDDDKLLADGLENGCGVSDIGRVLIRVFLMRVLIKECKR
jgi:hypothetical protein